jgi:hypothetical protein
MHFKQDCFVVLILLSLVIGAVMSFETKGDCGTIQISPVSTGNSSILPNINTFDEREYTTSQTPQEGIIDPVTIRQSAYQTTTQKKGQTDIGTNTKTNITIDDANGWFANNTQIDVTDVRRIYSVNGTFEDGTAPWTPYTYNGGSNIQITSYNASGKYVVCQNVGQFNAGQKTYTHSLNSEARWAQTIANTPASTSFRLKFDYRYASGPIDPEGDDFFAGNIGIFWELLSNGGFYEGWYYKAQLLDSRTTWYSVTQDYTLPSPDTLLTLRLGIYINTADVKVYVEYDYDDDPLGDLDGVVNLANAQNLTAYFDNIEFTSSTPPNLSNIDLTFHAGALSVPITGTGSGTAIISNPSFWTSGIIETEITANTSAVFTYSITTLFHRNLTSSWTTNLNKKGVAYTIDSDQGSDLRFFTYVTPPSAYFDSTIDMLIPNDWENVTIWDPLMNDITGLCSVTPGRLHVPTSELSRSGWWEIDLNGLNYAKNISVQIFDSDLSMWSESALFRPSNKTRIQVEVGITGTTPSGGNPANISWLLPNGSPWTMDSITTMIDGVVTSSVWTFGRGNTTAGEWLINVLWTNGTEIAFESVSFALFHSASISAKYPVIETDYGLTISNLITLKDNDTNEYLLDDSITMEANWSSSIVSFSQNYAKNWWEADFDTSLIGNGRFVVQVNASMPYFDEITTQFTVISLFETSLEILNAGLIPIENGLNEIFTVQLSYELLNGTGVAGALPTVTHTGPQEGLSWHSFIDNSNGFYSLDIVCNTSDIYEVTITLSKPFHYNTSDSFTLIIGETGSALELLNGTSDLVLYGDSYRLVVEYRNSTGQGLLGANLQVVAVTPTTGLTYTNFTPISGGQYEIILTPGLAGTFSIVIRASILNHETQYATFTLTASGIPTILTSLPSSAQIAVDRSFTIQLEFLDESLNPIDLATITIVYHPTGLNISDVFPLGGGLYNITLTPLEINTFNLLFRASLDNYQSSSAAFTLSVTKIETRIEFEGDIASALVEYNETYLLTVYYYRSDTATPINVDSGSVSVLTQDPGLLIAVNEYVGYYLISIRGQAIGTWSLTVTANKTDHFLASKQFLFEVARVPISVEILGGIIGDELMTTTLSVNITVTDTGIPVSGVTVYYRVVVFSSDLFVERIPMTESAVPGIYTAVLTMPDADDTYLIQISCDSEYYELNEPLTRQLVVTRSPLTVLMLYSFRYWWAIVGVVGVVGVLSYRRISRKRRVRENKVTLAIKRRFDDVRSLLGVIVIHKDSGLPVYSKILRDGLEEAVISAFITAITSFRGEFDIESSSEEWGLIPISDIVRVISTNRLVCAFITTGNPSPEQRERMIQFAKTVGFIFDETLGDIPIVVLDHHTKTQFDALFEDILDGALLRTYKLDETKKFPTTTCANERIARKQGVEFKLEELASEIAACGLEEGRVYKAIMAALEEHYLVTTDESPFANELIRASEPPHDET